MLERRPEGIYDTEKDQLKLMPDFNDLIEADIPTRQAFKELLSRHKGEASVVVHPYFDLTEGDKEEVELVQSEWQEDVEYLRKIQAFWVKAIKEGSPVIIFEESEQVPSLLHILQKQGVTESIKLSNIMVVPTLVSAPEPLLIGDLEDVVADSNHRTLDDLLGVAEILQQEYGLNKAVMVGGWLSFSEQQEVVGHSGYPKSPHNPNFPPGDTDQTEYFASGCLGRVAEALRTSGVEIEYSEICQFI